MVDLSILRKAAEGPDLDEVRVTKRTLRVIAQELAEGRMARARLAERGRVDAVVLDIALFDQSVLDQAGAR